MKPIKQKESDKEEVRIKIKVPCKDGLNVLCAARWSEYFRNPRSDVIVRHKSEEIDGTDTLSLLSLGATWQGQMEIVFTGEDAEQAASGFQKAMKEVNRKDDCNANSEEQE